MFHFCLGKNYRINKNYDCEITNGGKGASVRRGEGGQKSLKVLDYI